LTRPLEHRAKEYSAVAVSLGAIVFAPLSNAAVVNVPGLPITIPPSAIQMPFLLMASGKTVLSISNSASSTSDNNVFANLTNAGSALGNPGQAGGVRRLTPVNPGHAIPGGLAHTTDLVNLVSFNTGVANTGFLGMNKTLGFSFHSGGNIHYGWVELTITQNPNHSYNVGVVAAAYESSPNMPINAPNVGGPSSTPAPNSLWLLALGAAGLGGLELLRRRRTA
jgi:MYXO-CTERM domain-containing protein